MSFIPSFYEIRLPSKDIRVVVTYSDQSSVHFIYTYNGISGTFMGLQCVTYTSSIRGLLRSYPSFFEDLSEHSYEKDLKAMGFIQVNPPEKMIRAFGGFIEQQRTIK